MSYFYSIIQWRHTAEAANLAVILFNADDECIGWRKAVDRERIETFTGMSIAALDAAVDDLLERPMSELGAAAERIYSTVRPTSLVPTVESPKVLDMLDILFLHTPAPGRNSRPPTQEQRMSGHPDDRSDDGQMDPVLMRLILEAFQRAAEEPDARPVRVSDPGNMPSGGVL